MTCAHALMRRLAGGVCPLCGPTHAAAEEGPRGLDLDRRHDVARIEAPEMLAVGHVDIVRVAQGAATGDVPVDGVNPKSPAKRTLTRAEAEELLRRIRARKAFASLHAFIVYAWPILEPGAPMQDGWHIKAIADHVQWQLEARARAVADPTYDTPVQNLLVNIPPRCLKSRIISVCATAWAWLHWPHLRILVLSTNPRVSVRDGDATLCLIRSTWYQDLLKRHTSGMPRKDGKAAWEIRSDKDGQTLFANTGGGTRTSRGLDSTIVGEGADWIIVDDPHDARDTLEAMIKTNEGYDAAVDNRINDPRTSIRTGVMQRLNAADWSAHVLAQGWVHLCLPMEFELDRACSTAMPCNAEGRYDTAGAPLGWSDPRKAPGEVLHPRFTREYLALARLKLGEFGYAGQMQQRPVPLEGGTFKRGKLRFWRPANLHVDNPRRPAGCVSAQEYPAEVVPCVRREGRTLEVPEFDFVTLSVDCSFKDTADGSRVGLVVIGGRGVKRYVLHDHTRPLSFTDTIAAIRLLVENYPGVPFSYRCTRTLVEDKANGPAVINVLNSEVSGLVEVNPEGGKVARASAMQPTIEAGQLYLLEGASWLEELVEELCTFPNGRHDDRVDALSQAITYHTQSDDLLGLLQLCSA